MPIRQDVYDAIDGERDYQDKKWNVDTTESGGFHSVAEFVLYMEHYLQQTRVLCSTLPDPTSGEQALHFVRKVTALGVACMEQNGAPRR